VIGPVDQKTPSDNTIDLSAVGPIDLSNEREIQELNRQELLDARQKTSRRAGFKSKPQDIDPYDVRSSVPMGPYDRSGNIKVAPIQTSNVFDRDYEKEYFAPLGVTSDEGIAGSKLNKVSPASIYIQNTGLPRARPITNIPINENDSPNSGNSNTPAQGTLDSNEEGLKNILNNPNVESGIYINKDAIRLQEESNKLNQSPKQYGGPSLVPYSNEYMAQQYADYKNFYDDYTRPPSNRTMGDGYDEYDSYMRRNIKKNPIYASGWLEESKDGKLKIFYDEADNNTEPQPSSKYNVRRVDNEIVGYQNDPVESNMISDMSHAMAWQNAADRRKNRFPQNMYPGFLKSQQKGGQLYLYRNGGLPKFQGPDASELTALKPRTYPDPFKAGVTESNMEYPEEILDVVQTTKPNFLQGVVRAMPYMNFANNMYDRISAENQRNKLRQQATSIEGIVSPISDYKGRFSEYGAYQPNLQGFQGMGSAQFGGNITDGEYYLSDSEIQDIINMGGEVEFLED
jgi:hypothetical protein